MRLNQKTALTLMSPKDSEAYILFNFEKQTAQLVHHRSQNIAEQIQFLTHLKYPSQAEERFKYLL